MMEKIDRVGPASTSILAGIGLLGNQAHAISIKQELYGNQNCIAKIGLRDKYNNIKDSNMYMIIMAGIMALIIIAAIISRNIEKREWNNGICKKTYIKWRNFGMDSSGARGYTDDMGNYCWISWNIDKKQKINR